MPTVQRSTDLGMQMIAELEAKNDKERKEIKRLRRVCHDLSRLCVHSKSQREKEEEEAARQFAKSEAAREAARDDALAILKEKERLEATRLKGNKLDGVLTKLERQIERERHRKQIDAPSLHARMRRTIPMVARTPSSEHKNVLLSVVQILTGVPDACDTPKQPDLRWPHALHPPEVEYLTSLFFRTLKKGQKARRLEVPKVGPTAESINLQELKEIVRTCGSNVHARELRILSKDYRLEGVRERVCLCVRACARMCV